MSDQGLKVNRITQSVIGAAIEVHRTLGPGLLESVYEASLCRELELREVPFQAQIKLPVEYKGMKLDCDLRLDVIVEDEVVVEVKALETVLPVHEAQLLTYLKLTGKKIGLLINFNTPLLRDGLKRIVLGLRE